MSLRKIKFKYGAHFSPIADLLTWSPLPSRELPELDPFIFLNHHGYQEYPPHNNGLPFGPHPHRGMETVTFIIDGDIAHLDSQGNESVINAGGVQWMTAGSGLVHAEVSSSAFKSKGGPLEILQLWLNLPGALKMTKPNYEGKQQHEIPLYKLSDEVVFQLISGACDGHAAAFESMTQINLKLVHCSGAAQFTYTIQEDEEILCYLIRGEMQINGISLQKREGIRFDFSGSELKITTEGPALLLLGHGKPFREPVVARGPFVMNTEEEIRQAYMDFASGKMGQL